MNKAVYTERPEQQYPLTTDALDFIQNQILQVQQLAQALGNRVILYGCVTGDDGSVTAGTAIINGEILPLSAKTAGQTAGKPNVTIQETSNDITAGGVTYSGATKTREIAFTSSAADDNTVWAWDTFKRIDTVLANVATDTPQWIELAIPSENITSSNESLTPTVNKCRYARRNGMIYFDVEIALEHTGEYAGSSAVVVLTLPNKITSTDFLNYNMMQYRTDSTSSNNWHVLLYSVSDYPTEFQFNMNNGVNLEGGKVIRIKQVLPDF